MTDLPEMARSDMSPHAIELAALAQLVEHHIRNVGVRCSSHLSGTTQQPRAPCAVAQSNLDILQSD